MRNCFEDATPDDRMETSGQVLPTPHPALTELTCKEGRMANRNIRPVRVEGQVTYVELTKGYTATVSASDAHDVGQFNWIAMVGRCTVYAVRSEKIGGKNRTIYMHRFLANAGDSLDVDHIDGNGLNNCRDNLRQATRSENCRNRGAMPKNKIGLKGVYPNKSGKSWCAKIRLHGKGYYLGSFETPEAAHGAYLKSCSELHGEFGRGH